MHGRRVLRLTRGRRSRRRVLLAVTLTVPVLLLLIGAVVEPAVAQSADPPVGSDAPPEPDDQSEPGFGFPSPFGPFGGLSGQVTGQIHELINAWFRNAITNATRPVMDLLAHSLLATPDLTVPGGTAAGLWWTSMGLANTAYVLLIGIGGAIVMTHETLQTRYALKDIAPRLIVGLLLANTSLLTTGWAIDLANALSGGFLSQGIEAPEIRASRILTELLLGSVTGTTPIFLALGAATLLVLAVALIATAVVRVVITTMLIVVAPLALACHALPQTDGAARLWWRALAAVLGVQVAQALTLVTAVQVFLDTDPPLSIFGLPQTDLVGLIAVGGLLWVLLRIPVWATRAVFSPRPSVAVRLVKTAVVARVPALRRP